MTLPARDEAPARIFIGTDPSQEIACKLLQRSMQRHTSLALVFDTMASVAWPLPNDPRNHPRTEFSFHRFAIPKLAGYHGRALYVDADMLVFRDLRELWNLPFGEATVLHAPSSDPKRPKQFSVMLLDCDRLRWQPEEIVAGLDSGRFDYEQLVGQVCLEPAEQVQPRIPIEWNSLDRYQPRRTGLLHFTHIETQPWVYARHPHGGVWVRQLLEAIDAGVVTAAEVDDAVERGWARPSLPVQLRTKPSLWPMFGRLVAPLLDRGFKPHRALRQRLGRLGPG
ncbi:MAG: glycosyltransferase [Caldimonas sp.]